jgi:hypothetical protein
MEILFRKTIEQCRQLGARGGRAHARNLRLRQSQAPLQPGAEIPGPPSETVHQASLRLDAQFPWLAAAFAPRPTHRARPASGGHRFFFVSDVCEFQVSDEFDVADDGLCCFVLQHPAYTANSSGHGLA